MASERLFSAYPPFPVSIPIASIPQISLSKVLANDPIEAQQVFTACRTLGFFLLDLQEEKLGAKLLGDIEKLFGVTKDLMDLSIEEKSKYAIRPPTVLTG